MHNKNFSTIAFASFITIFLSLSVAVFAGSASPAPHAAPTGFFSFNAPAPTGFQVYDSFSLIKADFGRRLLGSDKMNYVAAGDIKIYVNPARTYTYRSSLADINVYLDDGTKLDTCQLYTIGGCTFPFQEPISELGNVKYVTIEVIRGSSKSYATLTYTVVGQDGRQATAQKPSSTVSLEVPAFDYEYDAYWISVDPVKVGDSGCEKSKIRAKVYDINGEVTTTLTSFYSVKAQQTTSARTTFLPPEKSPVKISKVVVESYATKAELDTSQGSLYRYCGFVDSAKVAVYYKSKAPGKLGVSATYTPKTPTTNDDVTITATADVPRNRNPPEISIFVNDGGATQLVTKSGSTCSSTSTCSYKAKYPAGTYKYKARALSTVTGATNAEIVEGIVDSFTVKQATAPTPTPTNKNPVASIVASTLSGNAPLTVNFDAFSSSDSDGTIVSYTWKFGDGAIESGKATASHTYTTNGAYTVTLTVTDNSGGTGTATKTITVNQAPAANNNPVINSFTATATAAEGGATSTGSTVSGNAPLKVEFFADATDPDGDLLTYKIKYDAASNNPSIPATTPTIYSKKIGENVYTQGAYTAQVTVQDNRGGATSGNVAIKVDPPLTPTLSVSINPTSPQANQQVTVTASSNVYINQIEAKADGGKTICGSGTSTSIKTCSTSLIATPGTHTYGATGTTKDGKLLDAGTSTFTVGGGLTNGNPPEIKRFEAVPSSGAGDTAVTLWVAANDLDDDSVSYVLEVDKSNPAAKKQGTITKAWYGASQGFPNTYTAPLPGAQPSKYYARLTVTDSKNNKVDKEVEIIISPPAPLGNVPPAIDSFAASTTSGSAPLAVTFTGSASDPNIDASITYSIQYNTNDPTTITSPAPIKKTATTLGTYTYITPGVYTAKLFVTDSTGEISQPAYKTIVVSKAVAETVQTPLAGWWNLISLPGDFTGATSINCGTEDELWIYFWDAAAQNYVTPAKNFAGVKASAADKIKGKETSFYIYSTNKCTLDFAGVTRTQGKGKIKLLKGWNFVPITKDIVGDTLDNLGANCDILAAYVFDGSNQQNPWQTVALGDILTDKYSGIVVWNDNTAGCTLGA